MFGYFTGAAKKAVSRRGKEPHKFRFARQRPHPEPAPSVKKQQQSA